MKRRFQLHGYGRTRIYKAWCNMRSRCNNPNRESYDRYGGRGIGYEKRWELFSNFLEDMGDSYQECLKSVERPTLERIDNNANYSKENCKWVSMKDQCNNRRNSRFIEYNGVKKTLGQWAEYLGIENGTFRSRFYALNWPIEKLMNPPSRNSRRNHV